MDMNDFRPIVKFLSNYVHTDEVRFIKIKKYIYKQFIYIYIYIHININFSQYTMKTN